MSALEAAENDAPSSRVYLRQFDLFRVLAFVGVVAQHCVLWTVPGESRLGWGLVMDLHATREVFFFLSALVAGYSLLRIPRPFYSVWYRRISVVLVPYLAWTLIYFCYTLATATGHLTARATLVSDLLNGYYQLYFLVVLFQVYIILPALIWAVRRTSRYHGLIFGASLVAQLAMMTISHYFTWPTGSLHELRHIDFVLINPRYVTCYQLYIVSGVLAAYHLDRLQEIVERHWARILAAAVLVGLGAEGYYVVEVLTGTSPGHASDLFQPVAVLWFLASCAGLCAIGWWWAAKSATRRPTRFDRLVRWGADSSGGFYLAHILVLQLIFSAITGNGHRLSNNWHVTSAVLFVGTIVGTGALVALLLRSPVRTVFTGPDRRKERERLSLYPRESRAIATATAPAMAR